MHHAKITHTDDYLQITITSDHMRDIVVAYVRDNTTTVVKERDGVVLRAETFRDASFQALREYLVREEPPIDDGRIERHRGV